MTTLYIWRHPKPVGVRGLCFGQTDVPVDRRKLKRLANRIDRYVKKQQLAKVIWVSPLSRSRQVGALLQQRGFECRVDPQLAESYFGAWEGKPWSQISKSQIDQWCDNFATFAPEGGESLTQLFERVRGWMYQHTSSEQILAIGHAGWITTAKMISNGNSVPQDAKDWPYPVGYDELSILAF